MSLNYIKGNEEILDKIKYLWEKQRQHHHNKSLYFKKKFETYSFESRKAGILENIQKCFVEIVQDDESGNYIGYCVSTLYNSGNGEVDSLYIEPEYRGMHIGDALMNDALNWLETNEVKEINIYVATGNEDVFGFYERFGFKPFVSLLKKP